METIYYIAGIVAVSTIVGGLFYFAVLLAL